MDINRPTRGSEVLDGVLAALFHGAAVVRGLDDAEFRRSRDGESSIGAHIRHNLDHVNALLNGIAVGRVDYSARARDPRVESDRGFALEQIAVAIERLRRLRGESYGKFLSIRSENNETSWLVSSVGRELQFLHSHTVHHYAMIALLMPTAVHKITRNFGVAPSTLRYWSENAVPVHSEKENLCQQHF